MTNEWYVIAGGVCSGKTTLVNELREKGYVVVSETARELIDEGMTQGLSLEEARGDVLTFQRRVLERQMEKENMLPEAVPVFLDRGIPDSRAFLKFSNIEEPEDVTCAIESASYKKVFLLEPVRFESDYYRIEFEGDIDQLHEEHVKAYEGLGHTVVHVPVMPVPERVAFILSNL